MAAEMDVHFLENLDEFDMEKKEDGTIVLTQKRKIDENDTATISQIKGVYECLLLSKFLKRIIS